jgi:uncharacterized protein YndB with AHSA1/START domain
MLQTKQSEAPMNQTTLERRSEREIVMTRTFNAPARLVFEAWTKPEHVKRWWAPKKLGCEVSECSAEVRVGGKYRYVTRTAGGDFAFSGEYIELAPHTRIVYSQIYEPYAEAGAAMITVTLSEKDGKTFVTSHDIYPSKEACDGAVNSGMEVGLREVIEQLEELLKTLS